MMTARRVMVIMRSIDLLAEVELNGMCDLRRCHMYSVMVGAGGVEQNIASHRRVQRSSWLVKNETNRKAANQQLQANESK